MKSNWITATIDDVCTVVTDGAHNSPKSVEQGHYMASVKDFTEFGFDFSNCKQIGEEDYEKLETGGYAAVKEKWKTYLSEYEQQNSTEDILAEQEVIAQQIKEIKLR
mgnify:CR=1 FL=1